MFTKHPSTHNLMAVKTADIAHTCQQRDASDDGRACNANDLLSTRRRLSHQISVRAKHARYAREARSLPTHYAHHQHGAHP